MPNPLPRRSGPTDSVIADCCTGITRDQAVAENTHVAAIHRGLGAKAGARAKTAPAKR